MEFDEEDPVLSSCPMNIVLNTTSMLPFTNATWMTPNATDNSGNVTLISTHNPGDGFAATTTQVTYTATDPYGNKDICTFNVTVIDAETPTLNCVSNVTVYTDLNSATANVSWPIPETTDNSGLEPTLTSNYEPYTLFDIGTTLVMYTSTDASTNMQSCMFNVTVIDNEDPIFDCPSGNIMAYTDETQSYSTVYWNVSVTDNSGNVTYNCTRESGDQFEGVWPIIQHNVSCIAQDPFGNDEFCFFSVTVDDNENPNITCPSDFNVTTDNGQPTAWIQWDVEYTDNTESLYDLSLTGSGSSYNQSGENFPIGTTILEYIVTDAFGNSVNCTFYVTVRDEEDPVLSSCPMNIVLNTTSMLPFTNATWMTPNATDNSGNVTLISTHNPGDGFAATTTQVTYTATDPYGNKDICTFNVTVIDAETPTLNCVSNVTVYTDLNSATANVSWPIPETTDNSGLEPILTSNYEPYALFDIGTTLVMYTSTDASNNMQSCMFNVTVIDNEDPIFDCPSGNIMAYTDETQSYSTVYWNVSVTDNSGNVTYNCTRESGDQFEAVWPIIQHNVSCIAQDPFGNDEFCFFSVTVDDNENPNITCPSDFNVTTDNEQPTAWIQWDVEYTDNTESVYELSLTGSGPSYNQSGENFPIGTTILEYIVTDAFGNSVNCTFYVTVRDTENPMLTCPDDIVNTTVIGEAYGIAYWVEPNITDNSGMVQVNMSNVSGDRFNLGNTTVYYYAEDPYENSVDCSFIVTINDFQIPIFDPCPSDIEVNTDPTLPYAVVNWTISVYDNVGVTTLENNHNPLDQFSITLTEVIYVATDTDGNQAECKFNITVTDNENPNITCPSDFNVTTNNGQPTAWIQWDVEYTDNTESLYNLSLTGSGPSYNQSGENFPIGTTILEYIVTDAFGNSVNCTFYVTVRDEEDPVISSCPMNIVLNTTSMLPFTNATWMTPNATDNSGNVTLISTHNPGDGFAATTTQVTYTATDPYGNKDICTFSVTVIDAESPTLNCVSNVTVYTDFNSATANVSWPIPETTDNSGLEPILTSNYEPYTLFDIGTTLVMYTSTDTSDNGETCTFNVTVIDNEDPVFDCPDNIMAYTDESQSYSTVYWNVSVTDNSGNLTYNCTSESGDQFDAVWPIIQHNVSCMAQDPSENEASCFFSVTVDDNENPNITCPSDFNVTTDNGQPTAWIQWDVEYTDNTESLYDLSLTGSGSSYNQSGENFPIGTTKLEYTVTDAFGNNSSCTFYVTVRDTENPMLTCPDDIVNTTVIGEAYGIAYWVEPNITDNSGMVQVNMSNVSGDQFNLGNTTVYYYAEDPYENSVDCSFIVTINDFQIPIFDPCPSDIEVNTDPTLPYAVVNWTISVYDNVGVTTPENNHNPLDQFSITVTEVIYVATDTDGNQAECKFNITVTDNEIPVIDGCPQDVRINTTSGLSTGMYSWPQLNATDNSGFVTLFGPQPPGNTFTIGDTSVTYIATDNDNNLAACEFTVTVNDMEAPVISSCPEDMIAFADVGDAYANVSWVEPSAMDNSGSFTFEPDRDINSGFPIGSTIVTYTAIDESGNRATCSFNITVFENDEEDPVFENCPTDINRNTIAGKSYNIAEWPDIEVTDNIKVYNTSMTHMSGDNFSIGMTAVVYTAFDSAGNVMYCEFIVWIIDDEIPTLNCPEDIYQVASTGKNSSNVTWNEPVATDNSGENTLTSDYKSGSMFYFGETVVAYTIVDPSGNSNSCSFTVNVTDNEAPTISNCPVSITVEMDEGKNSTDVTSNYNEPTITDNNILSDVEVIPSGRIFFSGTTTVTYTAIDVSGNIAICSFDVTVIDTQPPEYSECPSSPIVELVPMGMANRSVSWTEPTAMDNAGVFNETSTHRPGDDFGIGTVTVTYTVFDVFWLSSTCMFEITVQDTENPVFMNCPTSPIEVDTNEGLAYANVSWDDPEPMDNSGVFTVTQMDYPDDGFYIGFHTVSITALDEDGNIGICSFTIIVEDKENPEFNCSLPSVTVYVGMNSSTAQADWILEDATDNVGVVRMTQSHNQSYYFDIGMTIVTYNAWDEAGNEGSCSFHVIVKDNFEPVISGCPDNPVISNTDPGQATGTANWTEPTAFDNSGYFSWDISHQPLSTFPIGETWVSYNATDNSGNAAYCWFVVAIIDTENPVFMNCPISPIEVYTNEGLAYANVSWDDPEPMDNSGVFTVIQMDYPGDGFYVGFYNVTITAVDEDGNIGICSFTIIVEDNKDPEFNCNLTSVTVNVGMNSSTAQADWILEDATDNVGVVRMTQSHNQSYYFDIGMTIVTYNAWDEAGNEGSCSFYVIVIDNFEPVISGCLDYPVMSNTDPGQATGTANWTEPTAFDNSGYFSWDISHQPLSTFPIGETWVSYNATDNSGNAANCWFVVVIIDDQPPEYSGCPFSPIVELVPMGMSNRSVSWTEPTATDNVGVFNETSTHSPGDVFEIGTFTVTYTVFDVFGLSSTCRFNVTVQDTEKPVFLNCPTSPIEVYINEGLAYTNVSWDDPEAMDNSGVFTVTQMDYPGDGFYVGFHNVTITAVDEDGNIGICSFTIIVEDNEDPEFNCSLTSVTVNVGMNSSTAQADWILEDATDNVGVVRMTQSHNQSYYFDIGMTMVTYSAWDEAGNEGSCSFNIFVIDNFEPIISGCPENPVISNTDFGQATGTANWTEPTAFDNSGYFSWDISHQPLSTFPIGETWVSYNTTDNSGNAAYCWFVVVIIDNEAPRITCPSNITMASDPNSPSAVVNWMEPNVMDNGEEVIVPGQSHSTGSTFSFGETIVVYTATDAYNNTAVCSFYVYIYDDELPVFTNCPTSAVTNVLLIGQASMIVNWTDIIATDNDGSNPLVSCEPEDESNFDIGTFLVTCNAIDMAGLNAICEFDVIIADEENPVTQCPGMQMGNTNPGQPNGSVSWTVTASDNSGNYTIEETITSGALLPIGNHINSVTVTDPSGNQDRSCFILIVIEDNEDPEFNCSLPSVTVYVGMNSSTTQADWILEDATDNVGVVRMTKSHNQSYYFDIGMTMVTYNAWDEAGNEGSCSFYIIVIDNFEPVISGCPDNPVMYKTNPGQATGTANWTEPTAFDNSGYFSWDISHQPLSTFPIGETLVSYNATDNSGNTDYCLFVVIIIDTENPVFMNCPISPIEVYTNESLAYANVSWDDPESMDNSGVFTVTQVDYPGDGFYVGFHNVTITAVDEDGNIGICSFTIIVEDNEDPEFNCSLPSVTVYVGMNSSTTQADWILEDATDNVGVVRMTQSHNQSYYFDIGMTMVTYNAWDEAGNKGSCSFNIFVIDNFEPVISGCPDNPVISNTDPGQAIGTANWTEPTAFDNSGYFSWDISHQPLSTFPIGETWVSYNATDNSGNAAYCWFVVVVIDKEPPEYIGCLSSPIVELVPMGTANRTVSWTEPTAMDNVGVFNETSTHRPGDVFEIGTVTVTYTVFDVSGLSSTCMFNVTVQDTENPVFFNCPINPIEVDTNEGLAYANVSWDDPEPMDNSGVFTVTQMDYPGDGFYVGFHNVTITAVDEDGNIGICSFTIIVEDNFEPVISGCPDSLMFYTDPGQASGTANWTEPTAFDNSGYFSWDISHQPLSTFPIGETWVSYNATDNSGNTAYCWFVVVIIDNEAPRITCPSNITMASDPNSPSAVVNWMGPNVMDNSEEVIVPGQSHLTGSTFSFGETIVVYTATDAYNNTAVCSFTVYIYDDELPVFTNCPTSAVTNVLPIGQASMIVNWTDITATDNDGSNPLVSCEPEDESIFNIGTFMVTCNTMDMAGLTAVCQFDITVTDEENPVVTQCPGMQMGNTSPGQPNGSVSWTVTASDNSGNYTIEETITSGALLPIGNHINSVTVTDPSGNQDRSCLILIVIEDNEDPSIYCPANQTLETNVDLPTALVTWENATAWDNSLNVMITSDPALSSPYNFTIGRSVVVYTATDGFENSASCEFIVWVQDTQPPDILSCPNNTELVTMFGNSTVRYFWDTPVAIDNSGNEVTFTSDIPNGSDFESGNTTVTITADDGNNNVAYCNFTVTVIDGVQQTACSITDTGKRFSGQMTNEGEYTEKLNDPTSEEYKNYAELCRNATRQGLSNLTDVCDTLCTEFRNGSIIAEFVVTVNEMSNITQDMIQTELTNYIQENNGMLGELVVSEIMITEEICADDYCKNGGVCSLTDDFKSLCTCAETYTGTTCEELIDYVPVFSECPEIIAYNVLSDSATVLVRWTVAATDNSGIVLSLTSSPYTSGQFRLSSGNYTNVVTAEDENENRAMCTFQITVQTAQTTYPIAAIMVLSSKSNTFLQDLDDLYRLTSLANEFVGVTSSDATADQMSLTFYFTSSTVTEDMVLSAFMAVAPSNVFGGNTVTLFITGDGPCVDSSCSGNGVCMIISSTEFACTCNTGWEADICSTDINECTDSGVCPIAGETCQNSLGSYRCLCAPGQWRIDDLCTDVVEFISNFVITVIDGAESNFTAELNDETSEDYQELQDLLLPLLVDAFDNLPNYLGVRIIDFADGSVKVYFVVVFETVTSTTAADVSNALSLATAGGNLGDSTISVDDVAAAYAVCVDYCQNGGICSTNSFYIESCTNCNAGWDGNDCSTDLNECTNDSGVCPIAGETCQNSLGSYRCLCAPGQWRIDGKCTNATEFISSFVITSREFTSELEDKTSDEYYALQDLLLPLLENAFDDLPNYLGVRIIDFTNGSIKVSFVVVFEINTSTTEADVFNALSLATQGGILAGSTISVDDVAAVITVCVNFCQNGGTCETNQLYIESCTCPDGYSGDTCNVNDDPDGPTPLEVVVIVVSVSVGFVIIAIAIVAVVAFISKSRHKTIAMYDNHTGPRDQFGYRQRGDHRSQKNPQRSYYFGLSPEQFSTPYMATGDEELSMSYSSDSYEKRLPSEYF
ncbi:uncharacterized protein [Antedon mediterranea]|uniref:uncharacterized protein n=1 Tax=Antedon mediterranea TaxID=105859 RepID=UPI003AF5D40E